MTGTITQVLVSENDQVKPGQLLVVLDDSNYKTAVAQARGYDVDKPRNLAKSVTVE